MRFVVGSVCVLVLALGCGGVFTTSAGTVTADVKAHLESVYGEPFEVYEVRNRSNAGAGIVDRHTYKAAPLASPDLQFTGTTNYEVRPTAIQDTYRCARILPEVKAQLARPLAPHVVVANDQVWCDNDALPLHPTLAGDLGGLSWDPTVHSYTDGPLEAAVAEARALASQRNRELRLPAVDIDVLVFPAALQPSASAMATGFLKQVSRFRATARDDEALQLPVRFVTLEQEVTDRVAPLLPSGAQFDVTVGTQGPAALELGRTTPNVSLDDVPNAARQELNAVLHVAVFDAGPSEPELLALSASFNDALPIRWTLHLGRYSPVDGDLWAHPEAFESAGIRYSTSMQRPTYEAPGFVLGPAPGARKIP